MIPSFFITYASDILGNTSTGLTGSQIAKYCSAYAVEYNIEIPYSEHPFPDELQNKRTALKENLKLFNSEQQYRIIKELCELEFFEKNREVKDLKIRLVTKFNHLESKDNDINETLVEETKHWLSEYPDSLKVYEEALQKYQQKLFKRNLLDDIRLSLELLLKNILENDKSIENQVKDIGRLIKDKNGSKELTNMFTKLIDYFSKYQNTYVKHSDSVNEEELEFVYEMASSFMKLLIRMK